MHTSRRGWSPHRFLMALLRRVRKLEHASAVTEYLSPSESSIPLVLSASVTGASHRERGKPCQDQSANIRLGPNIVAVAVADGAGSARHAELGAKLATQGALDALRRLPHPTTPPGAEDDQSWSELLQAALSEARSNVLQEATRLGLPPGELASTLLIAIAAPQGVIATQIGDGGMVVGDGLGGLCTISVPQRGEYANETYFLTGPDAVEGAVYQRKGGPVETLAVFSDGLEPLCLHSADSSPAAGFFLPLFQYAADRSDALEGSMELGRLLASPFATEVSSDDITLVVVRFAAGSSDYTAGKKGRHGGAVQHE